MTQISEYIKTKGFGVDVRLLIAQLAEHFGLKSTQIIDLANLLQQKFDNLEGVTQSFTNNINSLVAQMEADKDAVIANATVDSEVILARGGRETLGKRLDSMTDLDGIYPDHFEGSDIEKVQKAFDMAILTGKSVITHRMYDLTGGTVYVNKGGYNTLPLDIISVGGGFEKYDDGFMFSSNNGRSDNSMNFYYTKFESDISKDMIIIDGDKIIGTQFVGIKMYRINGLISSPNYIQSIRVVNSQHFDSRKGTYLIEAKQAYDVSIIDNRFEAGAGGVYKVSSDEVSQTYDNNVIRIENNVMETRGTTPIVVGNVRGFRYVGNYNENNHGENDLKFVPVTNAFEPVALTIDDNIFYKGSAGDKIAIDLTGLPSTTFPRGVSLRNNFTDKHALVKISDAFGTVEVDLTGSYSESRNLVEGNANVKNFHKLSTTGTIPLISGFNGYARYTLSPDNLVTIEVDVYKSNASDDIPSGTNFMVIPEAIRPSRSLYFIACLEKASNNYMNCRIWVQTNGSVQVNISGSGKRFYQTFSYYLS